MTNKKSKIVFKESCSGFTLIELVVSIGILGLMIAFSSVLFRFSIDAHRFASANAEIMHKARAITGQLSSDFSGLRKDAPMFIWFEQYGPGNTPNRYDRIMFFADGDFSSWQFYDSSGIIDVRAQTPTAGAKLIQGTTARIYYGHAWLDNANPLNQTGRAALKLCLARRQHILTQDAMLANSAQWFDANDFTGFNSIDNNRYEHDWATLGQWKLIPAAQIQTIIDDSVRNPQVPAINTMMPSTFHQLMAQGVGSFSVQIAYWERNTAGNMELRWFPSNDPDGDGNPIDTHFINGFINNEDKYGIFFNLPDPSPIINEWYSSFVQFNNDPGRTAIIGIPGTDYVFKTFPDALKFTFRLYDSKGIIKDGKTFTHIVYLNN